MTRFLLTNASITKKKEHPNAEANYTIHTSPQESAKCGDKIKAYISCFHLQLNPSFPFFRDI